MDKIALKYKYTYFLSQNIKIVLSGESKIKIALWLAFLSCLAIFTLYFTEEYVYIIIPSFIIIFSMFFVFRHSRRLAQKTLTDEQKREKFFRLVEECAQLNLYDPKHLLLLKNMIKEEIGILNSYNSTFYYSIIVAVLSAILSGLFRSTEGVLIGILLILGILYILSLIVMNLRSLRVYTYKGKLERILILLIEMETVKQLKTKI